MIDGDNDDHSSPSNSINYNSENGCPRYYTKSSTCYCYDVME